MKSEQPAITVSVVIPFLNEEAVIPVLVERLRVWSNSMSESIEFVFVDDGSTDNGPGYLSGIIKNDPRFRLIILSRNFGHQAAVSAGLKHARGLFACVIDADLQDPPELISQMLHLAKQGNDVVYAVRRSRKAVFWKRWCYRIYYRILKLLADTNIPLDSGDFCLISRRALDALNGLPETSRFVRGLRSWVGFRQVPLFYDRPDREAGAAKYNLSRLIRLGLDGIFAFSTKPLRLATYLGMAIAGVSVVFSVYAVIWRLYLGRTIPGFASLAVGIFFIGGVQLVSVGILGEYIARIYLEVKRRPSFIVADEVVADSVK